MSDKFFVTGYPRSRSAWLANLLTFGDSFCYHDAMLGLDHIEQLKDRLESAPFAKVGISDPANLLYWRELREWYPDAKWVVVIRDFAKASESSLKAFGAMLDPDMERELAILISEIQPLLVRFTGVSERCAEIADYCGVDIGSKARQRQLCRMNIQVDPKWLREGLAELKKNQPQWIREKALTAAY